VEALAPPGVGSEIRVASVPPGSPVEARWNLAFVGILAYLIVEYTRLPAMFEVLLGLQLGKVAVLLSLLGLLVAPRLRAGNRSPVRLIDVALCVFVFASFLSACFARYQDKAWSGLADMLRWALICFLIGRIVTTSWRHRVFVFLFLLLNLKMAQFAIRGFFFEKEFGRSAEFLASRGVGAGSVGFFGNAGDFGVAMCVVFPMAGMLLFGETRKIPRLILAACFVAFSGAILVCGSRGAALGAVVIAVAALARNRRRLGAALIFLLFIPAFLYVLPEANKHRLRSALDWQSDKTSSQRITLWKAGLRMFADYPILGVGPASFAASYSERYAGPDEDRENWAPHSIYVQSLSELGLAGTLPLLLLLFGLFRLNARTRKMVLAQGVDKRKSYDFYAALALDLALIGYLVSGAFLTVLYYPHLWVLLGLSVGLYTANSRKQVVAAESGVEKKQQNYALAAS
jgi:putative inorganic carbon (HCO3(-)) transporter